jgi:serine/threonine-protein kinase
VAFWGRFEEALKACERLVGARHVSCAIAVGPVLQMRQGQRHIPSGATVNRAIAAARNGVAGDLLVDGQDSAQQEVIESLAALADRYNLDEVKRGGIGALNLSPVTQDTPPLTLASPDRPPKPGDLFDNRYVLGEELGRGGFGVVYEAIEQDNGASNLVIKLLNPTMASDDLQLQRFYNEGRLASKLDNDHIVRLVDYGTSSDGRPYITMERLDGEELADLLKRDGSLNPQQTCRVAIEVLEGLAAAHAIGLLHRDIKPANLFVCRRADGTRVIKIIDFGIAKDLEDANTSITQSGVTVGTPLYMSPEQVEGKTLDPRSDLYALGIVLFNCLSNSLPFEGGGMMQTLVARITKPPKELAEACSQPLPAGLADAIMKALVRERELRYPDADTMGAALSPFCEPGTTLPSSTRDEARDATAPPGDSEVSADDETRVIGETM